MKGKYLLLKLLMAMLLGGLVGWLAPGWPVRALNSFSALFGQFIKFIVPFIIVGLVTPAIAEAGRSAGRLLVLTMALAYASTLFSGTFAFAAANAVFPAILSGGALAEAVAAREFAPYFTLAIPPVLDVTSALAVSFMFGLGMVALPSASLMRAFDEIKAIVGRTVERAVVPLLPFYIFAVISDLTASGRLAIVGGSCLKIMAIAIVVTVAILFIQYAVAAFVAHSNPFKALMTMMPAYLTGWGCCSSAATIPVTLRQTKANGVSDEVADLVIPLCANIHLSGSMANMVTYAAGLIVLAGEPLSVGAFVQYILMVSVIAVASPGIPGGVVLACSAVAETALGFSHERYALMIALYMSLDGMGTACNLTGDGAIAMIVNRFRDRAEKARS